MTGAAHTPGPWYLYADDQNGQAVVGGAHIEVATCWHHSVASIEQEMRANAQLIAAAPDLLAALKVAQHALITSQGLRATDQTVEQFDTKVSAGISRNDLEFTIDDERTLALIDAAISRAIGQ